MKILKTTLLLLVFTATWHLQAQVSNDSLLQQATLTNIVDYTIKHQPAIQKSVLDEQITKSQINTRLADWYPQVDFNYNLQHNFQLQTASFQGQIITLGSNNTSLSQFAFNQNVLSPDLILAATTAKSTRTLSGQITDNLKIDAVVNVSKAFYDVLLTEQQIKIADEDITRLERSLKDATNQYKSGIVDKTDYKRASIALNNAKALKNSGQEALKAKHEYLKLLMGYPNKAPLEIVYDSAQMENEVSFDINQAVNPDNRIEYRLLQTQKKLNVENLKYTKFSFLPSVFGFGAYNFNYLNNNFSDLYRTDYPNSYAGLTLAFPLVHGGKRIMHIRQAKWQVKKADWDIAEVQNDINAQYAQALASYNSSLANYNALKENVAMAAEVYNIIQLQYRSGVKTYLEVVTAQADLRNSQINYYNALYQVLSSKIDLQKALGQIKY